MPAIGVVVVLYHRLEGESVAVRALEEARAEGCPAFYVVTHDNTEASRARGRTSPVVDRRTADPTNPGLAQAYTVALEAVEAAGCSWLILLDQDTAVSTEYLREVTGLIDREDELSSAHVDVLVPKLEHGGRQVSPHGRPRIRTRAAHFPAQTALPSSAWYYNSGIVLRTAAVRRAGGFPDAYPLDYLDHALAQQMRRHGSVAWQLGAVLEHDLSVLAPESLSISRYLSITRAEERFASEFGTPPDRVWLLVRRSALALLALLRLRSSPSRSAELRAVLSAVPSALSRRPRD